MHNFLEHKSYHHDRTSVDTPSQSPHVATLSLLAEPIVISSSNSHASIANIFKQTCELHIILCHSQITMN